MDNQNITIVNGSNKFNFRVAVLIEHKDKVLLETAGEFWNMIGGRVHFGDSTIEAARRELKEELNADFVDLKLINVSENFFYWMGSQQQELLFVYKAIVDDSYTFTKEKEIKCADADKIFKWHNKKEVENLVCRPEIIKGLVKQSEGITHEIKKQFMKVEYNLISRGTESQSDCNGYMAISEKVDGKRYILPIEHSVQNINSVITGSLTVKKQLSISQIAVARFMLISKLFLERIKIKKDEHILVVGCGCVGFSLLEYLRLNGYTNIGFVSKNVKYKKFKQENNSFDEYSWIFDCTGKNFAIEDIFTKCKPMTNIVLMGTPREKPNIDLLTVHRKNLIIYGAHELTGFDSKKRQYAFDKIVNTLSAEGEKYEDICEFVKDKSQINAKCEKIYFIIKK